MPRLNPVNPQQATGKAKELLDAVQKKLGSTPNMFKTLANSPAVLEAYLSFSGALGRGLLDAKQQERIALAVGQQNVCQYCVSAHTAIGKMVGLPENEITASRRGEADDAKSGAALKFAQAVVEKRGAVTDADVDAVRKAGLGDGEVAEIVAAVALNIFTNYFNLVAGTEVDFPKVELHLAARA